MPEVVPPLDIKQRNTPLSSVTHAAVCEGSARRGTKATKALLATQDRDGEVEMTRTGVLLSHPLVSTTLDLMSRGEQEGKK